MSKRKQLGLSLQMLSEQSGVSKSLISKIERSEIQPSIKTAANIAAGLGINLSDMFRERADKQVIFHPVTEQFMLSAGEHHTRKRVSPITDDTCIEIYHDKINLGVTTDTICHTDASKFILAMDDGLSISAKEIKYTLNKGDCLYIAENVNHKIANESSLQINFITMHHRL
jgi:transcriptional regulator with XRE-family HTH domain